MKRYSLLVPLTCLSLIAGCSSADTVDTSSEPQFVGETATDTESAKTDETDSADSSKGKDDEAESSESAIEKEEPKSSGGVAYRDEIPDALRERLLSATVKDLLFLDEPVTLTNGVWEGEHFATTGFYNDNWTDEMTIDDIEVWWFDIDSDGQRDLVAQTISTGGGSGFAIDYVVFTESGQQKGVISPTEEMKAGRGEFSIDAVQGNKLELSWPASQDGDAACCPSLKGSGTYRWNGAELVAEDGPHFEDAA